MWHRKSLKNIAEQAQFHKEETFSDYHNLIGLKQIKTTLKPWLSGFDGKRMVRDKQTPR